MPAPTRLIIAVTGAQGTGKSTFARALHRLVRDELCQDVELLTDIGAVVELQRQGASWTARDRVLAFAAEHMRRERVATAPIVILDRCLLDALAYASVLGCLQTDEHKALLRAAAVSLRRVALAFRLRVTADYPITGAADESPALRRRIDDAIEVLATSLGVTLREVAGAASDSVRAAYGQVLTCYGSH